MTREEKREVKLRERIDIDRRRELIAQWRFSLGLTLVQIKDRLAMLDPPITVSLALVSKDVIMLRERLSRQWAKQFSVVEEFSRMMNRYEGMARRALRKSMTSKEPAAQVAWMRTASEIQGRMIDTYFDAGIFNKNLPALLTASADEGKVVDRIPTGEEMQRYFVDANVKEGELVSEAERAYLYGDEAAANAAERE